MPPGVTPRTTSRKRDRMVLAALAAHLYRRYEGWTISRWFRCACGAVWLTTPCGTDIYERGVSAMGKDLCGGPVRDDGCPVFTVQVSSETVRGWVSLHGELDVVSAPHLQELLDQLCGNGALEIVLDLSGLEFVSAAGLTVFHCVADHLRAAGGQLILDRPRWLARRALSITGLDTVLTIRPAGERRLSCDHFRGRRAVLANRARG